MDSISNLPDEIIGHIGSFLSAKEAAFAMVLSRRWRNLFTIVPELQLHRWHGLDDSLDNGGMFEDFVDGVLALPVTTRIRKFSLKWSFKDTEAAQYDHIHINRCLSHVLKLGIMDLELHVLVVKEEEKYSLPSEVFTCKTVARLKLGYGFAIDFLPADAYLPSLMNSQMLSESQWRSRWICMRMCTGEFCTIVLSSRGFKDNSLQWFSQGIDTNEAYLGEIVMS